MYRNSAAPRHVPAQEGELAFRLNALKAPSRELFDPPTANGVTGLVNRLINPHGFTRIGTNFIVAAVDFHRRAEGANKLVHRVQAFALETFG